MNRSIADRIGLGATAGITLVLSRLAAAPSPTAPAPAAAELTERVVLRAECGSLPGAGVVPLSVVDRSGRGVAGVVVVLEDERLFQTDRDGFVQLPLQERGEVRVFGFDRVWRCVGPEEEGLLLEVERACPLQVEVLNEEGGEAEAPQIDELAVTTLALPCESTRVRVTARGLSGRFVEVDPAEQPLVTVTLYPGRELRVRGLDRGTGTPLEGARLAGGFIDAGFNGWFSHDRLDRDGWGTLRVPAGVGVWMASIADAEHDSGPRDLMLLAGPWGVSLPGWRLLGTTWPTWSFRLERERELVVRCHGLPEDRCPSGMRTRCEASGWSRAGRDAVSCPAEREAIVRWGQRAVVVRPQDAAAWFDLRDTAEVRVGWMGEGVPQLHRLGGVHDIDDRRPASCDGGVCRWVGLEAGRWRMVPPNSRRWEEGRDVDVPPGPVVVEAGTLPVPERGD